MSAAAVELPFDRVFDPDVYGDGDPETFGLPLDLYERMRADAPCLRLHMDDPMLIDEMWVVSRHSDICEIGRDNTRFVSDRDLPTIWRLSPVHPVEKPGLLVQDGEKHMQRRQVIGKTFSPGNLRNLEERFRAYAEVVVEQAIEKGTFDFISEVAHALPIQALGDVMGVPEADREWFFRCVDTFVSPYDERMAPSFDDVAQALMEIWQYGLDQVELKKDAPGEDIMSMLAQMDLPDNEIEGHVAIFATGAAESTRAALGHGLHELMRNPEQMAWLRERQDEVPHSVAHEMVRIANPGLSILRTAACRVDLHGQQIEEGDRIAPLFPSGNFDPGAIPEPRQFDLARWPANHVAFGRGVHSCIGKHVAVFEIRILLEELLKRTTDIEPAGPISYIKSNVTRGVYSLPVTVTPA